MLLVVATVYQQQLSMYENKQQRVDDRIVSLTQPHIRPIVRGKAGTPVEFGAKLSVSYHNGYVFIDRLSWENFNESGDLKSQAEDYKIDRKLFDDLLETLELGSLCALGGGLPLPIKNALQYFDGELKDYFK